MTTESERIEALEREFAALKERVGSSEAELQHLPDLVRVDIRLSESRIARRLHSLETQMDDFRASVDRQFSHVEQRFDAMFRIMAELSADVRKSKQ
jgi:predicted  nucleic acid-binding Zn-ribbon protein